jgi:hypothetical protein
LPEPGRPLRIRSLLSEERINQESVEYEADNGRDRMLITLGAYLDKIYQRRDTDDYCQNYL